MESDDDYQSFSPLEEPSPKAQNQRLKRLKKKAIEVPNNSPPPSDAIDPLLGMPRVDFAKLEALEAAATKTIDSYLDDDSNESLPSQIETQMEAEENHRPDSKFDEDLGFNQEDRKETKRALDFDDVADAELDENLKSEKLEKKRSIQADLSDKKEENEENSKKKRSKRMKSDSGGDLKCRLPASDKRRQEKERKDYLKQLHAESQRLLRETREAAFKPIPVVNKPISSVLEKIRQRKLELSKRNIMLKRNVLVPENNGALRDDMMSLESRRRSVEEREDKLAKAVEEDSLDHPVIILSRDAIDVNKSNESAVPSSPENSPIDKPPSEESTPMFRAPIDDTQDLFEDSETKDSKDELPGDLQDSPAEEVMAPSLLAMNLKFDSVPSGDSSSEEDNDKENMDPHSSRDEDDCTSPTGAPFKAFLDEEAEEEDDSDNDLLHFKENEEDEDMEDSEELNDIIATEYEERPIDYNKRNELHQKWLEQQDAAGTENLLQRLNVGSKPKETTLLGEEQEGIEDGEDYNLEDVAPRNSARMNTKKAKQIISQMFLDKDDLFLSDEDEEMEKKRAKQHLLVRAEEQAALVSPMEDESSREVFGLIKKLNIVPENKKKAKASSYFDSVLKGGNNRSFSKSSFLGRMSNHPLPSSHKQGSGTARSFIFGRDDTNSRSSISMSDDSSDTISKENQSIRTVAATVTSSQAKLCSQYKSTSAVRASGTSLFEILKRSSVQSTSCNRDDPVDLTHILATFKVQKKAIKIEGRN